MNSEIDLVSVEGQVNLVSPLEFNLKAPTAKYKCNDTLVDLNIVDFLENVCMVSTPEKLSDDEAFILLMDNGQVVAVASYNSALKGNNYLFLSASCLGYYVLTELKDKGMAAKDVYAALKVSDVQQGYEELAAVYQASGYQIDDIASGLNDHSYMQNLQSSTSYADLAPQAHFTYQPPLELARGNVLLGRADKTPADHALQVLDIASKVPFLKTYAGPATSVFKTIGGIFGLFSKELSLHDIMQKLQELESKLDDLMSTVNEFFEKYLEHEMINSVQNIRDSRNAINNVHQQLLNQLGRHGSDISGYISWGAYKSKRINKLATVLSASTLTDIQTKADALKATDSAGYLPKYFNDVTAVIANKVNNAKPNEDLLAFFGDYNAALMEQYHLVITALSQALFLELTALYLKVEHNAEVFPAGNYGSTAGSGNFQKMSAYLTKQYDEAIRSHTTMLDGHLVPLDLIIDENSPNAKLDFPERVVDESGIMIFRSPTHLPVLFATKQAMGVYNESDKRIRFYPNNIGGTISTYTCDLPLRYHCSSNESPCKSRKGTDFSIGDLTAGAEVIIQPSDSKSEIGTGYFTTVKKNTCEPVILTEEQVKAIQNRACILFDDCK